MTKVLASGFIVALSLFFGFLPRLLTRRYVIVLDILETIQYSFRFDFTSLDSTDPKVMKKEKKKWKNISLSFLLNLGGGVLIANCFCHWLPEVREGLDGHKDLDTYLNC